MLFVFMKNNTLFETKTNMILLQLQSSILYLFEL